MDPQVSKKFKTDSGGFTLIELLIVIAIVLILIAVALPNFMEAQMRAKLTKARGDIRAIVQANELYYLDWKTYPTQSEGHIFTNPSRNRIDEKGLFWLTTPVPYLTSIPFDPFPEGQDVTYETGGIEDPALKVPYGDLLWDEIGGPLVTYAIFSGGPDQDDDVQSASPHYLYEGTGVDQYSPTNGTRSGGDIFHFGGDSFWIGVAYPVADYAFYRKSEGNLDQGLPVHGQIYLHRMPPGIY